MLEFVGPGYRLCDRLTRRAILRLGALAPLGLSLPTLLAAADNHAAGGGARASFGRAKRCLMLYMWGGPAHQDIYDLKPDAPLEFRGEFRPRATKVPGIELCEHLPKLAGQTDKMALVRSVTHTDNNHSTAAHWMLTGRKHSRSAENFNASPDDFPHIGSVVSKLAPAPAQMPTFVALPERIATTMGAVTPGQDAGILGRRFNPFTIDQHPDLADFKVPSLRLPEGVDPLRVEARRGLLQAFESARPALERAADSATLSAYRQQAFDMILSAKAYEAFNLAAEPDRERDRYGRHTFGQSVLLARRLLEAGVKLVTVYWHRDQPGVDTTWDTHSQNFIQLKDRLLPQVDQPLATLLDDFDQRGLLDDTLIVWTSEFGRTPRVNNSQGGRDHWGACNTVWFAGAGVPGGQVYGSSDSHAAYPKTNPVHPEDLAATIFHLLGLRPDSIIYDPQNRPLPIAEGQVLHDLLGNRRA